MHKLTTYAHEVRQLVSFNFKRLLKKQFAQTSRDQPYKLAEHLKLDSDLVHCIIVVVRKNVIQKRHEQPESLLFVFSNQ